MRLPELTPTSEKIDKIINRINSGDIKVPAFQRSFIWKQNQVIELMESIINNFPIGSVLLWNTKERLNHTRNIAGYTIPESKIEYPVNYVLDGQQRISTIYGVFSSLTTQEISSEKYNPNLDLFEIYFDFVDNKFKAKSDLEDENQSILLRDLLDTSKMIDAIQELDKPNQNSTKELYSKFINYEVPVVTINHRTKQEVGVIFERINNTGTKLSTLDLMTAWTWTDDFHLIEEIDEFREELAGKNFEGLSNNLILQVISAILQSDTTTISITYLSGERIRDNWDKIKDSIKKAIDFLSTEMNCKHLDFLPYHQMMVPISTFFSLPLRETAEELNQLKRWFWKISFSNRYSTGRTTVKMNLDIKIIKEIKSKNYKPIDDFKITSTKSEFVETNFSKGSYLTRAFLLLIAQFHPIDLAKNIKIDIGDSLSEYNRKQYHHVFPNAFLKGKGFSKQQIFSVANFCFLPADSNKKISRKAPSDYFFNIIPESDYKKILNSNLLPLSKDLYREDNYITFIEKRAELIMSKIEEIIT